RRRGLGPRLSFRSGTDIPTAPGTSPRDAREEADDMGIAERLHDIVAPICAELDVELVDDEYTGGDVPATIDWPDGVDMDAIARVTRAVSRALDEHDPISGRYTLEVSSPGLERPLRTQAHFSRAVGSTVRIKTRPGVEGDRRIDGVLSAADDDGVTVT